MARKLDKVPPPFQSPMTVEEHLPWINGLFKEQAYKMKRLEVEIRGLEIWLTKVQAQMISSANYPNKIAPKLSKLIPPTDPK